MVGSDEYISVRDWRRRPPLRLRVTKKLDIHWCWIKCTRCPHMRAVAIAPYVISLGTRTAGGTCCGEQDAARSTARGAWKLQHPSWGLSDTGWAPMPISQMAPVAPLDRG